MPLQRPAFFQKIRPSYLILLLAVLQAYCATYLLQKDGWHAANSLIFFFSGLAIAGLTLCIPALQKGPERFFADGRGLRLVGLIVALPVSLYIARRIMAGTPVAIEYADMLPIIKVQGTRFLEGKWGQIYDPIPEFWGGIQPIYLPALWLPHIYPVVLGIDMRWITFTSIWACVALCLWPGFARRVILGGALLLGLLLVLRWFHFEETNNVIRLTEEGIVYFYYALLAVAIIRGNPYVVGICAALCFLSRYALIGWIPFAGLYLLLRKEYTFLLRLCIGAGVTCLVLLAPTGLKPLAVHLDLPSQYIAHAERVWRENPEYFYHSLGLTKFFGPKGVRLGHAVLQWGTFLFPLLLLPVVRRRAIPRELVLLAGFQWSITFFYNFIDVSYLYLYYTPVFVSLAIGAWLHRYADYPAPQAA